MSQSKKRSTSMCGAEGPRLPTSLPKRSQSFRSCLKKETTPDYDSRPNSRRNSGSKAVMFRDEIGETLVAINKYDARDPLCDGYDSEEELNKYTPDVQSPQPAAAFSNPRICKVQSFSVASRPRIRRECRPPPNSPQHIISPCLSPLLNKRDRIPNIVLTRPLDEKLSDIEDSVDEGCESVPRLPDCKSPQILENLKIDSVSGGGQPPTSQEQVTETIMSVASVTARAPSCQEMRTTGADDKLNRITVLANRLVSSSLAAAQQIHAKQAAATAATASAETPTARNLCHGTGAANPGVGCAANAVSGTVGVTTNVMGGPASSDPMAGFASAVPGASSSSSGAVSIATTTPGHYSASRMTNISTTKSPTDSACFYPIRPAAALENLSRSKTTVGSAAAVADFSTTMSSGQSTPTTTMMRPGGHSTTTRGCRANNNKPGGRHAATLANFSSILRAPPPPPSIPPPPLPSTKLQ